MYNVFITKLFESQFKKLPESVQEEVKKELGILASQPTMGAQLTGILRNYCDVRIQGIYRLIYEIEDSNKRINIIAVGLRKSIYENLQRYIKKSK